MSHAPPPFSTQRRAPSLLPISRDGAGREEEEVERRTAASLAWLPLRVVSLLWTLFYRAHTTCVEFLLDATLGTLEESAKTVNYELFASVARFANAWSALIITLLFSPGYYKELRERFRTYAGNDTPPKPSSLNTIVALGEELDDNLGIDDEGDGDTDDEEMSSASRRDSNASSVTKERPTKPSSRSKQGREEARSYAAFERLPGSGVDEGTSNRRGLLEDFRAWMEVGIVKFFSAWRNGVRAIMFLPSPKQEPKNVARDMIEETIEGLKWDRVVNYDQRTTEDLIRQAGYPYEKIMVLTEDGYVIQLDRIPRKKATRVVYMQHGLLDSAMGWIANGVVGSQAFAAYDAGADVFLGNMRGCPPRRHRDKSKEGHSYWKFSMNELGLQDVPAFVDKILQVKGIEGIEQPQIDLVAHSLGGAASLIYLISRLIMNQPHHISRLVLLSPAGFHHKKIPPLAWFFVLLYPLQPLFVKFSPGLFVPTHSLRVLFQKLMEDIHSLPALSDFVDYIISKGFFGGDKSSWHRSMRLPHYNLSEGMPGTSYQILLHICQCWKWQSFVLYDHGPQGNYETYGTVKPLDVSAYYHLLDIPVHLVGGSKDGIVPAANTRLHYKVLRECGRDVTYKEFNYGHLDFTVSVKDELKVYILKLLQLGGDQVQGNGSKAAAPTQGSPG